MVANFDDGLTHSQGFLLLEESDSAKHLLAYGLRALRSAAFHDTTRDPVMTMLSIGVEKLLKLGLGLIHVVERRTWPSKRTLQTVYRHDIVRMERLLRDAIRDNAGGATHRLYVDQAIAAVDADPVWPPLVAALNRHGQEGRFFYLDALAESPQPEASPQEFWNAVDNAALDNDPGLNDVYARSITNPQLADEFNRMLNARVASSLQQWWDMVSIAGVQGVLGVRGQAWGLEIGVVGRQVAE